jgi:hypothetical protein
VVNILKIPKSIGASFPAGAKGLSRWCWSADTRYMVFSAAGSYG